MRRMTLRGLVAAMEEEQKEVVPAEVVAPMVEGGADAVENDLGAMTTEVNELDVQDDQVESAQDDADALTDIAGALDTAAQNGGVDRVSAECIAIAVESIYNRLGITAKPMPAMESFGGTSSRVAATRIAAEEIMDNVKKVGAAIVAMLKKAYAWLVNFTKGLFLNVEKLQKKATTIKAAVETMGAEQKATEFSNTPVAHALVVNESVDVVAHLDSFNKLVSAGYGTIAGANLKIFEETKKAALQDGEKIGDVVKELAKTCTVSAMSPLGFKVVSGEEQPYLKTISTETTFGNKSISGYVQDGDMSDADDKKMTQVLNKLGVGLNDSPEAKKGSVPDKMKVLSKDEAGKVLSTVNEVLKTVDESKKTLNDYLTMSKEIISTFEKENKSNPYRSALAGLARRTMITLPGKVPGYALSTSNSLLNYVDASVKAHNGKAEEKKEEAKPEEKKEEQAAA